MIGGDAATRIYHEVLHGKLTSPTDTEAEGKYRAEIVQSVRTIKAEGGGLEPTSEFP